MSAAISAHLPLDPILPKNLAVANFCIESLGVEFPLPLICPASYSTPWRAKPGCAERHRAAVERIVNLLPSAWLLPPQTGELFDSLGYYDRRLRGYSFAEGFNIIRKGGGSKANSSWRFFYLAYGE